MARPQRNNVDYFPFICKEGKAMYYIEQKYKNDGYATWVKILRHLAVTNYHHINLSDHAEMMYLASKCSISEECLINIINDLCKLDELDKELWENHKTIFSQKFIDSIQDAYLHRSNQCVTREQVIEILNGKKIEPEEKVKREKKQTPVKSITHEPFKINPNNEQYFDSLLKGNEINEISRITGISVDVLKLRLEAFKKAAELSYPTYIKFVSHFKNWVLKTKDTQVQILTPKVNKLT